MSTSIDLQGLTVRIAKKTLLHPLDLHVPAGQWLSVIGPNGAGKSTLLRALAGANKSSGEVLIDGVSVRSMKLPERARAIAWLSLIHI